ncbi:uncharacterized protein [Nicotiana tomentosiformis]|uniref:uncharacterized protein n=1 Tax=Nicotiana tomentosiformis TaxID=4098 RepID=UPI00388C7DA4
MTVVTNDNNELIPTRIVTGWRVCMDYRKLNKVTRKDHFSLPFLDQMLDRLAGCAFYCFLDGYSGYNQILIALEDQKKITFTCPYGTFAFKRMPFVLYNAPATFQRLLENDAKFNFDDDCMRAFEMLKFKLTTTPIITTPNWNIPFELMCDESAIQASKPSATPVPEAQDTPVQHIPDDGRGGDATFVGLERSKKKEVWEDRFVSLATFTNFRTWWPVRSLTLDQQF